VFDPSTKELHRGKEGQKESESEKEKVIFEPWRHSKFDVNGLISL
jgi:hypothetical protein